MEEELQIIEGAFHNGFISKGVYFEESGWVIARRNELLESL